MHLSYNKKKYIITVKETVFTWKRFQLTKNFLQTIYQLQHEEKNDIIAANKSIFSQSNPGSEKQFNKIQHHINFRVEIKTVYQLQKRMRTKRRSKPK